MGAVLRRPEGGEVSYPVQQCSRIDVHPGHIWEDGRGGNGNRWECEGRGSTVTDETGRIEAVIRDEHAVERLNDQFSTLDVLGPSVAQVKSSAAMNAATATGLAACSVTRTNGRLGLRTVV
jgi:hypothetical protein